MPDPALPGFCGFATMLPQGIALRLDGPGDVEFLAQLYASTRADEMALVPWGEQQKRDFLRDQFELQDRHFRLHYPATERLVVTDRDTPAGRLFVQTTAVEVRLMDVALIEHLRCRGIGTALVGALTGYADGQGLPVTLHVEPFNPALRLYLRLGFLPVEMRGIYQYMARPAGRSIGACQEPGARTRP